MKRQPLPATLGAQWILCDQITEAIESLQGQRVSGTDIHSARKSIKKARATLRLLRDGMSEAAYRRENVALRDAARPLSAVRDARVLVETLDRLEKLYGRAAAESIPKPFRQSLKRDQNKVRRPGSLPRQRKTLAAIRNRIKRARIAEERWDTLGPSLQRVYANGRNAMKQALRTPTPVCFHEWRKQEKHLWHQLQVLEPLWPGQIQELAKELHRLSDWLGDDHDLAVLREQVVSRPKCFDEPGGPGALLALIDRCQQRLRAKATKAGARIYAEKPRVFTARFGRYWRKWKASEQTLA
jgi:CHAD domain-containing protein